MTAVYLDSAIVVKLVVREPDSDFYAKLVHGQVVWTSELALTECFSALLRKEREGAITSAHRALAWKQIEADVQHGRLSLVPARLEVLHRARAVLERVHPAVPLRSLDAIHLASAEECASWPLCASDAKMRTAASLLAMPLTPPWERSSGGAR